MPFMTPQIDARVTSLAPGFRALSIQVDGATMIDRNVGAQALARACQSVAAGGAPWAQDHLSAWGEVFKRFGASPD